MRNTKIVVFVFLVMVICSPLLFLVMEIYGLPFGDVIVKITLDRYLSYQYPQQELNIGKVNYNAKNAAYHTNILDKNGSNFTGIEYYWKTGGVIDSKFNQAFENSFRKIIEKKVQELMPSLYVRDSTLRATINPKLMYRHLEREDAICISLRAKGDNLVLSKEQYIDFARKLIDYLGDENYNISKIQIDYFDKNYIKDNCRLLRLNKKEINLPKKEIIKLIDTPEGEMWNK